MDSEIRAFVHHSLPVRSIKELANALFKLHNVTVIYGYPIYERANHCILRIFELGSYVKADSQQQFLLLDTEFIRYSEVNNLEESEDISFEFYEEGIEEEKKFFTRDAIVHNRAFDYPSDSFNRAFNGDAEMLASVLKYREWIKSEMDFYGGDFAIYIDDEGAAPYVQFEIDCETLVNIVQKLKTDFGDDFLYVSDYFKNLLTEKVSPRRNYQAYYDDFKDLRG